jgi:hypothetical protein
MVSRAARSNATSNGAAFTTAQGSDGPPFPNFQRHYDAAPDKKWQIEIIGRICDFASRGSGWDWYAAPPVKWDAGMFALNILNSVMQNRTPLPQVVPTPVGGVQLEWHENNIDFEIHVTAPYEIEMWFEDHSTGDIVSTELTDDLSPIQTAIRTLTAR